MGPTFMTRKAKTSARLRNDCFMSPLSDVDPRPLLNENTTRSVFPLSSLFTV